jgi:DNA-binding transcriptional ArsR family regulator
MGKLYGAQRRILQAVLSLPKDTAQCVTDSAIREHTQISLTDVRDWIDTLGYDNYVDVVRTDVGVGASITAKGRLELNQTKSSTNGSTDRQKRSQKGKKMKAIELKLNESFDTYSPEDQERLLTAVGQLLSLSEPIQVLNKSRGCVRLVVEIPEDRTEELLAAIREGKLAGHNVMEARVLEPQPAKDRTSDTQQTLERTPPKAKATGHLQKPVPKTQRAQVKSAPKKATATSFKRKAVAKGHNTPAESTSPVATTVVKPKTVIIRQRAKQEASQRQKQARRASILLKHVSDPTRLQLILALAEGEKHVGNLIAQIGQSQPAVSHHLALLRHGGIIAPRRQGKNNFYGLTKTGVELAKVVTSLTLE